MKQADRKTDSSITLPVSIKDGTMHLHQTMGTIGDVPDFPDVEKVTVYTTIPPSHVVVQVSKKGGGWTNYEIGACGLATAVLDQLHGEAT